MRNVIVLLSIVILLPSLSDAQDFWQQSNGPHTGDIRNPAINSRGHIFAPATAEVYRSTDNGKNWELTSLTGTGVMSLAIRTNGDLFAGTTGGVFRSTDNGDHWLSIGLIDIFVDIRSLAINSSGHIFAGTTGGGVYRSVRSTTFVKENKNEIPVSFELSQNYPNPFNSSTRVGYSLPKSGYVVLKIYDTPGRELQTLVDKFQTPGEYDIIFDARSLSSGIYFYKFLVGGGFEQTKKMILIR